jgi:PAT family beta-lactamase induction signal transducer AmpG
MPAETPRRSWSEAFAVYLNRRVLVMLFLGFSAGLPFLLIFSTLSTWLREAGVSRTEIGFFSWVGITFSIKVLWAPVIDRLPLPGLTRLLGRRRSWMLIAQLGIAAGLMGIAVTDPGTNVARVAIFALVVAFSAATQDVSIDAYRIEAVAKDLQGAMAATYQAGYRIAFLASGAGALYIAEFVSWPAAYAAMAASVLVGVITVLVIREPEVTADAETRQRETQLIAAIESHGPVLRRWHRLAVWFSSAVVSPFVDFFARNGSMALAILALVAFYRVGDITMGVMANPFYIDLGFTKKEIADISKVFGLFMTMIGAFAGGLLVARYGMMRPLLLGAVLMILTNLVFAYLAATGRDIRLLVLTISGDNLAAGIAGSALIAYMSSLTNTAYTATQYALLSSLFTLPGKFLGGFSGIIVDATSYVHFFIYAGLLGIPAILLVLYIMSRSAARQLGEEPAES